MAARERIPDDTRAAIERDVRAGELSCRAIAKAHGVSPGTVRNITKAAGIEGAFARVHTENATRARVVDMAARRARLAERALDVAERMLDRATAQYTVIVSTKDDVFHEVLPEPPLTEAKQAATAYGILVDKHCALVRFDTADGGNVAATSLADRLAAMLALDPSAPDGHDDGYPADPPPAAAGAGAAA